MALTDYITGKAPSWMTPEQAEELKRQQLLSLGASLLQSSGPSTDPRAKNPLFGLSQGLAGMVQNRPGMIQNIGQQAAMGRQQQMAGELAGVPRMAPIPAEGPVGPQGQMPMAEAPRSMADYLGDVSNIMAKYGDIGPAMQMMQTTGQGGRNPAFMEKSFAPVSIFNEETGETALAFPVFDPDTGGGRLEKSQIPPGFKILTETPEQKRAAEVVVAKEKKAAEVTGKGIAERQQDVITRGVDLAGGYQSMKRARQLLDTVPTGGVNAALLKAKQVFGVEAADEAELSNKLSKSVLSQLRSTFGAQFTEAEGARLERIEGRFSMSTEGNKRLLEQAMLVAEGAARRAIKSARKIGDEDTAREIETLIRGPLPVIETMPESTTKPKPVF